MIALFGFPMSNYYSIVKMCLLEKDIPFEEHHDDIELADDVFRAGHDVIRARGVEYAQKSPVGKIPCIGTPQGYLSETQVILEYLEEAYPQVPMLPNDAFARAKARELARVLDLHIELVVRRLYPEAFFGGSVPAETKTEVHELARKGLEGLAALTTLAPFATGSSFSYVDCIAAIHLPIAQAATARTYGIDLTRVLPNLPAYLARVGQRPSYLSATATIRAKLAELT